MFIPFSDLKKAIRERSIGTIVSIFFDKPGILRDGFATETEIWDFKGDCPRLLKGQENAWAEFAKDILGFHNLDGGIIRRIASSRRLAFSPCKAD